MSARKDPPKVPITQGDLEEFVASEADFGFEMEIRRLLTGRSLDPLHGGTYVDPVTGRSRQFDLRVQIRPKTQYSYSNRAPYLFRLAIECKNVREHYPVLIQCVPRARNESFHDAVATTDGTFRVLRFSPRETRYREEQAVGKNLTQVARSSNGFSSSDDDVYGKWAQAIASAADLAVSNTANFEPTPVYTFVMPVVVVPDSMLWAVNYDDRGSVVSGPTQVESVSFFVSAPLHWQHRDDTKAMTLSHIEFVTKAGLAALVDRLGGPMGIEDYFDDSLVSRYNNSGEW